MALTPLFLAHGPPAEPLTNFVMPIWSLLLRSEELVDFVSAVDPVYARNT